MNIAEYDAWIPLAYSTRLDDVDGMLTAEKSLKNRNLLRPGNPIQLQLRKKILFSMEL